MKNKSRSGGGGGGGSGDRRGWEAIALMHCHMSHDLKIVIMFERQKIDPEI